MLARRPAVYSPSLARAGDRGHASDKATALGGVGPRPARRPEAADRWSSFAAAWSLVTARALAAPMKHLAIASRSLMGRESALAGGRGRTGGTPSRQPAPGVLHDRTLTPTRLLAVVLGLWLGLWLGLCLVPGRAFAQAADTEADRAIQEPIRLTAGGSNQWMGVLDPSGQALYFVSDRNATAEIFVQQPVDSGPRLLFESNADVSWPLPGPDGKHLAFISSQADATGDLCLRVLGSGEQRCFTGLRTSEMQPVWLDRGRSLGVLMRSELHGDYRLQRFGLAGGGGDGATVLQRNMLGVAVSPDDRWLAYVPLARTQKQVGIAFANASEGGLALARLDQPDAEPVRYRPDLPGLTEFPAFALDGKHLYFAQYLNDTNGDGATDGNDHSVLFRVPFDGNAKSPIPPAVPEQLTSAQWNCRYPAPARDRLIVTCAHQGSLDIYALPLTGAVPASWDAARLRGEIHVARDHFTKLLLLARLASLVKAPADRIATLRQIVWLHLELREYEATAHYAEQIKRLGGAAGAAQAGAVDAVIWAELMLELAQHRRADVALTHGQLSDRYLAGERERMARVQSRAGSQGPDVQALAQLVLGEIHDDLGQKDEAQRLFAALDPTRITDPLVLEVFAQRARAIHTLRGERQALLQVYRLLAEHASLDTLDRLRFAEQFVEELVRGVPEAERPARVEALGQIAPESELGLMIQVAGWLQKLDPTSQEEVRAGIFELYKGNKDIDRRRALVLATVRAASREGNEYLQYQFATSWASWLRRSEPERKYAETLYRQIVLERAYAELAQNQPAAARGSFYAVTVQSLSLEGHIGFIEARLREGIDDLDKVYAERFSKSPGSPEYGFVQAYLIARKLPAMANLAEHERAAGQAVELLRRAAAVWPRNMEIQHVWGTVLHQRALRTGKKQFAIDAHSHYALALDLARDNVRFRAALLQQLGLLQASLGNHRIALTHFVERDRQPYVRPEAELNLRMAMARSYFQVGMHAEAVDAAQQALTLVDSRVELGRYRPLVLDRLALYSQAAGGHVRAFELYETLLSMSEAEPADAGNARLNRIKLHLGAVASALGAERHAEALQHIAEVESLLAQGKSLAGGAPRANIDIGRVVPRFARTDYEILVAGLRAQAHRGAGDLAAATKAMERRQALLERRFGETETDDDLLELARASYHLGEYAFRAGDRDRARQHFEQGLRRSARFNRSTGSGVNEVGLRLIQAYAELHIYGGVDLAAYQLDLKKELRAAYEFICKNPSPTWDGERYLFSVYLTMLELSV
jgi:tetratricopeptide (TPR) repeat protein